MSMTQTTSRRDSPETQRCPQCNAVVPPHAAFCGACGRRIEGAASPRSAEAEAEAEFRQRYRITSLVRRRPYISLFLATDVSLQQTVIISDVDISMLDAEARQRAAQLVRREYDLLRRHAIPHLTPILRQEYDQGHIYVIAGNPFARSEAQEAGRDGAAVQAQGEGKQAGANEGGRLYTLENTLQSGIGLPGEQVAVQWIQELCETVDRLHGHQIVIGELDPQALVLGGLDYHGRPALLLCWLPLYIRTLLPVLTGATRPFKPGPFTAPEVQQGKVEARSDVYSLGALLYLLLTGTPPAAPAPHLRSPRELNPRVKPEIEAVVMRALSFERSERFQSAASLAESLANPYVSTQIARYPRPTTTLPRGEQAARAGHERQDGSSERGRKRSGRPASRTGPIAGGGQGQQAPAVDVTSVADKARGGDGQSAPAAARDQTWPEEPAPQEDIAALPTYILDRRRSELEEIGELARRVTQQLQKRITGLLPALQGKLLPSGQSSSTALVKASSTESLQERSLLRQIQRFIVGEQQRGTAAAAIIETPLRLQPGQRFAIRVRLMGRDRALPPPGSRAGSRPVGLSALTHGERVHIEVRSAIYQRYAFVVQRAVITVPASGYVAEVTIPMPPPLKGRGGRRERLHIVFSDEHRRPLYEKPFAIEILVSPLVRPGQESLQALPIPY
ncbi:inactive serine/threonine-protein kinase VRK3 [Thermogemmatispora carboxidivorans]|uniref:inactive serine/threonine-protein kinase VRK3 n=1 Tax=Thermogemmatispora carboxidivorans TaxID=1382306 RepID=UPI00069C9244|nr:inactive serine/threonine-protein kinase VRK3 [Thermogemmatispora carboxidivorans]